MRFIYNTTFSIDENIAEEFIQVIRGGYIAYLKGKNLCNDILFTRVMIREGEGLSLSLQLIFPSAEEYSIFIENYKDRLLHMLVDVFGEDLLYFSTTLEEIEYSEILTDFRYICNLKLIDGKTNHGDRPRYKLHGICNS